jgi:hypothetical protein
MSLFSQSLPYSSTPNNNGVDVSSLINWKVDKVLYKLVVQITFFIWESVLSVCEDFREEVVKV